MDGVDEVDGVDGLDELDGLDGLLLVAFLDPEALVAAIPLLALQEVDQLVILVALLGLEGLVAALPLLVLPKVDQLVLLVAPTNGRPQPSQGMGFPSFMFLKAELSKVQWHGAVLK